MLFSFYSRYKYSSSPMYVWFNFVNLFSQDLLLAAVKVRWPQLYCSWADMIVMRFWFVEVFMYPLSVQWVIMSMMRHFIKVSGNGTLQSYGFMLLFQKHFYKVNIIRLNHNLSSFNISVETYYLVSVFLTKKSVKNFLKEICFYLMNTISMKSKD